MDVTLPHYLLSMSNLYIQSNIKITDNAVFTNGERSYFIDEPNDLASFLKSVYKNFGIDYVKFYKMDLLSKLGFIAAELILMNFDRTAILPEQIALLIANASASLNTDEKYSQLMENAPSPSVFVYTLPNIVIGEICIRHNIKGENLFIVQNDFDTEFSCNYITGLFKSNDTKLCLTGWIEVNMDGNYRADLFLISQTKTLLEFNKTNLKII